MAHVLELHKSGCPRFCQELDLSMGRPLGVKRMELTDLPCVGGTSHGWRKVGEGWPLAPNHTIQSVPDSAQTLAERSHQESRGWGFQESE